MNKKEEFQEEEKRYKYAKLDCEMRAKAMEIAISLPTSKDAKSLLNNTLEVAKYIFGIPVPVEEKK